MNKLKALLERFTGTRSIAPVAVGVTSAEGYGIMRKSAGFIVHADCTFDCDDDGNSISYCDGSGSDN